LAVYFFSSFNYRADEWNLKKPLKQCSLRVERRGDVLLVVFSYIKEGGGSTLFALTKIDLMNEDYDVNHYVQPVADSSRYFAIRVVDELNNREALVGLGFREREEAADFVQCLTNYKNAIARERLSKGMAMIEAQQ
jgi:adaptin ear-binding coat-associated protein 1/2